MVIRNLTFCGVCFVGASLVALSVLPARQIRKNERPSPLEPQAYDFDEVVAELNKQLRSSWDEQNLTPAPPADSFTVVRRLSLALTGTIPSLEEIRLLEKVDEDRRVDWWLERTLNDRRYSDYVAERLARAYVGVEGGPFLIFRRRRFVHWLSDQLHKNRRYDSIVEDLISDTGLWTDSPAVNFLTVTTNEETQRPDEERLAARTTRAFLGVRLDCMQCHDDNLGGDWLQSDFHELAAFYSESSQQINGITDKERDYEYAYLGEEETQLVAPRVPFAKELMTEGGTRRQQLARWVIHPENRAFSRTIVNRLWALLFGKPYIDPVDDIPLDVDFPIALDAIAQDFVDHRFDLRRAIRVIAATDAFRCDSRADHALTTRHEDAWACFPVSRLRPEQVAGSVSQSATINSIDADAHVLVRLIRFTEQNDFVTRYGDAGEDEFSAHGGTIPQRLVMLNGQLVHERTKDDIVRNAASRIAALAANDQTAILTTYQCVLTRKPSEQELEYFRSALDKPERNKAIEDMFWALMNSSEFSWNH